MKTLIIYNSKTGFTERYAKWLAQDLGCECIPYKKCKAIPLDTYDAIAFGSSLHAGTILGAKWFFKQVPHLKGKRLAIFFTGAMPPDLTGINRAIEQNIPSEARQIVPAFYLWGGLNYEKMGIVDKILMAGLRKMLARKKNPTPEDKETAKGIANSFDMAKRENLRELEQYLRAKG